MTFLVAATLTDSLASLSGDEKKAAPTTAFDLEADRSHRGHGLINHLGDEVMKRFTVE
jgi:hypothetical protein